MHILCPHCHNPIEVVKITPREEISCPSCGSSFHLEMGSTTGEKHRPGQTLGKFELIEVIGHGAFGTVYRARDPELDRTVALKVPRAGNLAGPQALDRFLREARSAAQLRHPSIVTVHDAGQVEGVPFLVSDFMQGVTLTDLLSGRRPGFRDSAELIAAVAEALHYAHERGVVHRDVKPSNIMIAEDGTPHVMDFGLAKRDAGEITMTVEGQVLGTPAYMPPEQARGEGHAVDARGDVYSLGVVLYQLLTGELPFRGTQRMLLHQVLHDEPRAPRSLNDHIPRDLETVCLKAMAKEPGRRYASAREMGDDLRRWLSGEPVRARPVGRLERGVRWARRRPAAAALLAVSSVALLAIMGLAIGWVYHAELSKAYEAEGVARGEAEAARLAEEEQRKKAESAQQIAEHAKQGEEQQRKRAEEALGQSERIGYNHSIFLADTALQESKFALARQRLQECKPELRNWEWRYLNAKLHPQLFSVPGVTPSFSYATGVRFSPDGSRLLCYGKREQNKNVRVYDAWTGAVVMKTKGTSILEWYSGSEWTWSSVWEVDGTLRVYDAWTGREVFQLKRMKDVQSYRLSPDGTRILTAGRNGDVRVYNVRTGIMACQFKGLPANLPLFSPDGKQIFFAVPANAMKSQEEHDLRVYSSQTGIEAFQLKGLRRNDSLKFSPNCMRIAAVGKDWMVRVYDARTGAEACQLKGPAAENSVECLFFNHDGARIAVKGSDHVVRFHDTATGIELSQSKMNRFGFIRIQLSPDFQRIAALGDDGIVHIYDLLKGIESQQIKLPASQSAPMSYRFLTSDPTFSPDGNRIATTTPDGILHIIDGFASSADRHRIKTFRLQTGLSKPIFSPDGSRIAATDRDGVVHVFDARGDALVGQNFAPYSAGFGTYGSTIAGIDLKSASTTGTLSVIDARTAAPLLQVKIKNPIGMFSLLDRHWSVSHDGTQIAVCDRDGIMRIHETKTGAVSLELTSELGLNNPTFSPDGKRIALGSSADAQRRLIGKALFAGFFVGSGSVNLLNTLVTVDLSLPRLRDPYFPGLAKKVDFLKNRRLVRVYDVRTGAMILQFGGPTGIDHPVFSPDGTLITTLGGDGTGYVYNAQTGREVYTLRGRYGPCIHVFSPDGAFLGATDTFSSAHVYEARTGTQVCELKSPAGLICLAFSPDGTRVAAVGRDLVDRLYDAHTGAEVFEFRNQPGLGGPTVFSRDGTRISCEGGGIIRIFDAPHDVKAWQAMRCKDLVDSLASWHRIQAERNEFGPGWFAAAFHLRWLVKVEPANGKSHFRLGWALMTLGQTEEAKKALETALISKKDLADLDLADALAVCGRSHEASRHFSRALADEDAATLKWERHVTLCLDLGDWQGYRNACAALIKQFEEIQIYNPVAVACTLGPEALPDLKPAIELVRKRVSRRASHYDVSTLGALLYRAGQYKEAIIELNTATEVDSRPPFLSAYPWPSHFLFLAMSHQRLEQHAEARKYLARARQDLEKSPSADWTKRVQLRLLLREAEDLILGKPKDGAK